MALDNALGYVDDARDPLRTLAAREEFEVLRPAFDELTPRRRCILVASRVASAPDAMASTQTESIDR
ncbi:MAG: hypothetical protein HXX10_06035 [Rhodoplanes sp.]|uniref:hypothetical protein n=1 Tax=Rhodoplanes sp. TaxID=1968906 RepID=UPI001853C8C2|nr:hypothetical protein [Rhodoplanes sp.]NVO13581.1 hypothetical protein [Rhodoplanes sp.]